LRQKRPSPRPKSDWPRCAGGFDIDTKTKRASELDTISTDPNLWNDPQRAQTVMKELTGLKTQLDGFSSLVRRISDTHTLIELAEEADDVATAKEADAECAQIAQALIDLERELMFSGVHDRSDAILSINAGTGGMDAQDWAEMLYRMYSRWAEAHGFKTSEVDFMPGEGAGIKYASLSIKGEKIYGWLRGEKGTHRLVRFSPFNAGGSRETSFARVEVHPDLSDSEVDIDLNPADLEIDTYRSRGAGGQNVQKNESAIRIKHTPTGIVVTCQDQRSQTQNRERALQILKARLQVLEEEKRDAELKRIKGEYVEADFGSQIRNYVMHPYQLVKDLRTSVETSNVQGVLNGDLDPFMEAYLKQG
jgi:peptide chain release factor 2